jgi:hypothetical protein
MPAKKNIIDHARKLLKIAMLKNIKAMLKKTDQIWKSGFWTKIPRNQAADNDNRLRT